MSAYLKLSIAALLPTIAAVGVIFLEKRMSGKWALRQIFCGVVFGILAIIGTEWGIPINGAQVNCRDAAVLVAGLMFGGPAGIIAGLIGGAERWIAVAWGVGTFTRVACTVSTIIAGFYAAALRKFMFDHKRPGWLIASAIGVVMEVFHLTMVFLTNMSTPDQAMAVVSACSVPMIVANGLSVMIAGIAISVCNRELFSTLRADKRITQSIQKWLLISVVLAFIATSFFVYRLQNEIAVSQENQLLQMALDETEADIRDASNENLLRVATEIAKDAKIMPLDRIASKYMVAEINVVNSEGIIVESTAPDFIGFDMASGEQSAEFLCLLNGETSYAQDYGPIAINKAMYRKYAGVRYGDGFIQVGYDAMQFQKDIDADIVGITKNRHVGKTGYILIIDEGYTVVSAPEKWLRQSLQEEISKLSIPKENTISHTILDGEDHCYSYRSAEGYHIIAVLPEAEVMQTRNIVLCVNAFIEILIFAVMFALIYMLIKLIVVNHLKSINVSLAKITRGNLNEVVNVRSNAEFASLSDDINRTVDTLKQYIKEASEKIDAELRLAKDIQTSSLPSAVNAFPKRKDFDIYAYIDAAKEIGGDFYDFYMTDQNELNFLIADVSGKGIPAAMFMMRAKTELKGLTESQLPMNEVFITGNDALCNNNDAGMFVTAWQGRLNLETGLLQYVNAGHNPPLVRRMNGEFTYLKTRSGFVLAGIEGTNYKLQELQLQPGDIVFLYTDGITEATNANNELFGEERLANLLNAKPYENVKAICEATKAAIDTFVGDAPQFDDMTMLALQYHGKNS